MWDVVVARWHQGHRTMAYPDGPPPELPSRFAGRPQVDMERCQAGCQACAVQCPVGAIRIVGGTSRVELDTGKCIFCRSCVQACAQGAIRFTGEHRLAATRREDLIVRGASGPAAVMATDALRKLLGRSLKLRQVSAGGCNACEADTNVLNTLAWDLSRFGIQFVASPRHADGLLITGPVSQNMRLALEKTYRAVPEPRIVIAVGSCAISGGPYADHAETCNGAASVVPVDLFVPGCPPHPLTILDALLCYLGRAGAHAPHPRR
jgi:Ni,Fe-hydrogenase III small subunit/NAD-dependent dihydropyrimidine dehydrogenase PreA subunit